MHSSNTSDEGTSVSILFGLTGETNFFAIKSAISQLGPDSNLALIL